MRARPLAALLAVLWSTLTLGCGTLGDAGPRTGSECIEGDDSHECEEADD